MITPNHLTALRLFIALVAPMVLIWNRSLGWDGFVILIFTAACITDWWDGHLARTKAMVTSLGKLADPIADKLLIMGLMLTFAYLGLYGYGWVFLILLREATVTFARLIYLKRGKVVPAEQAGKIKVGFQIGSIYATLLLLIGLDGGFLVESQMGLRVLFILHYLGIFLANVVTVFSGVRFFRGLAKS
ncbi:MAG: CDP-alcohol phosphatidyltransferase family protein [Candidatus Omnitrophica bacterium]|nr:CDP-alcohol phosphatidyltransferase family protein [Candidatus Omnitrophota bacterium]